MMLDLDEQLEVRDREIGEKILKLKRVGVLALDAAISAFEARNVSQMGLTELTDKVARMSALLQEIEPGGPRDPE